MKSALKIISGGQTGVDRAALKWALANGVPHGGWCPKGRLAEDGVIPEQFRLKETGSDNSQIRTRRNVRDSGGTVIFSRSTGVTGGTAETARFANEISKPLLHLISSLSTNEAAARLKQFVNDNHIVILNVAGPRESEEPGIGEFVEAVLAAAFGATEGTGGAP